MSARVRAGAFTLVIAFAASPVAGQRSIGVSADFMGYTFDDGLGAEAAQLFMVPVAIRYPIGNTLSIDLYSAWAEGRVERDGIQYVLSGPTDTRLKVTYQFASFGLFSVGASLPTGNSTHDGEEALVAAFLSADLFGFREATFGSGGGVTSALATAARAGDWGIGLSGAYSLRSEFEPNEPTADQDPLRYRPGNEVRVRLGIDRNIGTNTFTAGATVMNFSEDQANGKNLFQAGLRLRFDASYLFRAGAGVWSIYAADVIRQNGDLTLSIIDNDDIEVGDTTIATPSQNLLVAGLIGTIGVGGSYVFRPHIDFKFQTRKDENGNDGGSGWVLAAGGDFPVRVLGVDVFPKARALYGAIRDATGASRNLLGMEFTGTLRMAF